MARRCEIAWRLGFVVPCPRGGCRLAQELGEPPAEGSAGPCVVERIAGPRPEPIVLWTLDTLRRQLDATRPPLSAVDGEARDYGDDHIAIDRELAGRGMGFRA